LKPKFALPDTKEVKKIEQIIKLEGMMVNCDPPNQNLERYELRY